MVGLVLLAAGASRSSERCRLLFGTGRGRLTARRTRVIGYRRIVCVSRRRGRYATVRCATSHLRLIGQSPAVVAGVKVRVQVVPVVECVVVVGGTFRSVVGVVLPAVVAVVLVSWWSTLILFFDRR